MKIFFTLLAGLLTLGYPLLVYIGIQRVAPAFFAAILLSVAITKFVIIRQERDLAQVSMLLVAVAFSLTLAVTNNPVLLKLYPVIISLCVAGIFAASLRQPENMLLKLARVAGETITPQAQVYTRNLTWIWVILLLGNAMVALYLALYGSLLQWAFYCGFLSYLILAGFFVVELIYRRFYIARRSAKELPHNDP